MSALCVALTTRVLFAVGLFLLPVFVILCNSFHLVITQKFKMLLVFINLLFLSKRRRLKCKIYCLFLCVPYNVFRSFYKLYRKSFGNYYCNFVIIVLQHSDFFFVRRC